MIFATVGTQLPFDRLLIALDAWAARNPAIPVLAQVGASTRRFTHLDAVAHVGQSDFRAKLEASRLVVAHAGMGTILSAADLGKPVILMPRQAKFREHRNDHQQDTAQEMARLSNVIVVQDGEALHDALDLALAQGFQTVPRSSAPILSDLDPLIETVRDFVWNGSALAPAGSGHKRRAA